MSTTLTLSGVELVVGPRVLVRGLDLTLADGDVTALVGPNGSGKSTLMRTVVGDLPLEAGSIRLAPPEATVAWLPQEVPDRDESLLRYARRRTGVAAADAALERGTAGLAEGLPGADDAYAAALERWLALGAADLDDRLPEVAAKVGLDVDPRRPLGSLSGGQVARAALVAVLLSRHDVLLLDEPTNDLDAHGLELVTDFVTSHAGPVLIASHDRDFLDTVATSVVELDVRQERVGHYTGGWSDYVAARELERGRAWEAYAAYAGRRDALLDQSRQRAEWARRGRRAVARLDEQDKHLRERDRARADRQGAKGARGGSRRRPARGRRAAAQGVGAALLDQRGPAAGRRGRHPRRRRRRARRLPARPGDAGAGAGRARRGVGRQRQRQEHAARGAARASSRSPRAGSPSAHACGWASSTSAGCCSTATRTSSR